MTSKPVSVLIGLSAILFLSCLSSEVRQEITNKGDDGFVTIFTRFLPSRNGWVVGAMEDARAGIGFSGADTLLSRVLYRFDISSWSHGPLTLHLLSTAAMGTPGALQVFCVSDFPRLPDSMTGNPADVSGYWLLADSGSLVGAPTPVPNQWFTVTVPESVVATWKSSSGYLAFMLRLADENQLAENWFRMVTFDYAVSHGTDKPYVTYRQ